MCFETIDTIDFLFNIHLAWKGFDWSFPKSFPPSEGLLQRSPQKWDSAYIIIDILKPSYKLDFEMIQPASSARPIRRKTIDWLKARAEISYLLLMWIKSPKLGKCVKLVFNFRALKSKYIKLRPVQLFNTSSSPLVKWCHRHFGELFWFLLSINFLYKWGLFSSWVLVLQVQK